MGIKKNIRAILAEFLGTCFFIYVGCGAVISAKLNTLASGAPLDLLSIALAFGFSITSLAYTFGHYSGGHFNPIITVAMFIWGKMNLFVALLYIVMQVAGSIVGAALLYTRVETVVRNPLAMTVNAIAPRTNEYAAFLMEGVLSFLLVFVVGQTAFNPLRTGISNEIYLI